MKVSAGPGKCPFEDRQAFTSSSTNPDEIRVVSYNILADLYADSDFSRTVLFPQCPPYAMNIAYRKALFIKELLGYKADLMCLQEVDKKVFEHDLEPVFNTCHLDGVFSVKGGQVSEGLACFWNKNKFKHLLTKRTVLYEVLDQDEFKFVKDVLDANEQLKERFFRRTTALQSVVLDFKDREMGLVVGTTHLYYKPDADHIRLLQIGKYQLLFQFVKKTRFLQN